MEHFSKNPMCEEKDEDAASSASAVKIKVTKSKATTVDLQLKLQVKRQDHEDWQEICEPFCSQLSARRASAQQFF